MVRLNLLPSNYRNIVPAFVLLVLLAMVHLVVAVPTHNTPHMETLRMKTTPATENLSITSLPTKLHGELYPPTWLCTTTQSTTIYSSSNCDYSPTCSPRHVTCAIFDPITAEYTPIDPFTGSTIPDAHCIESLTTPKPLEIASHCSDYTVCQALQCNSSISNCVRPEGSIIPHCECKYGFIGPHCDLCPSNAIQNPADPSSLPLQDLKCGENGTMSPFEVWDASTNTIHPQCGCKCSTLRPQSIQPIPTHIGESCECPVTYIGLTLSLNTTILRDGISIDQDIDIQRHYIAMILDDIGLDERYIATTHAYHVKLQQSVNFKNFEVFYSTNFLNSPATAPLSFFIALSTCNIPHNDDSTNIEFTPQSLQPTSSLSLQTTITQWLANPNAIIYNTAIYPHNITFNYYTPPVADIIASPFTTDTTTVAVKPKIWQYTTAMWVSGLASVYGVYILSVIAIQVIISYHRKVYVPSRDDKRKTEFLESYKRYKNYLTRGQSVLKPSTMVKPRPDHIAVEMMSLISAQERPESPRSPRNDPNNNARGRPIALHSEADSVGDFQSGFLIVPSHPDFVLVPHNVDQHSIDDGLSPNTRMSYSFCNTHTQLTPQPSSIPPYIENEDDQHKQMPLFINTTSIEPISLGSGNSDSWADYQQNIKIPTSHLESPKYTQQYPQKSPTSKSKNEESSSSRVKDNNSTISHQTGSTGTVFFQVDNQ